MAKVDWITWKTNNNEIINPDLLLDKVSDKVTNNNIIIDRVKEIVKSEIYRGGLDTASLNIMGVSHANEKANRIIENLNEVQLILDRLKQNIYNSAKEQKKTEKEELIETIQNKLIEEEKILNNKISIREKLDSINTLISNNELDSIIQTSNDRIKKLKEKLDLARSL